MSDTVTQIQARPKYIQEYDEALLARIFGTPDEEGVLTGGLIDDPELFRIPDYVQAGSPLQGAVTGTFDTAEERQAFMDRYLPYFQDETGMARYLPDASAGLETGQETISDALTDYFPDAKTYLDEGRGSVDAKGIYDTELTEARTRADQGTGAFDAMGRSEALLGDARDALELGIGQAPTVDVDEGGQFGAREAFERGTGRAFELAEQGLGRFDPGVRTQEFMDPYKEQVIDAAMSRIARS